jgi:hypothetical protein
VRTQIRQHPPLKVGRSARTEPDRARDSPIRGRVRVGTWLVTLLVRRLAVCVGFTPLLDRLRLRSRDFHCPSLAVPTPRESISSLLRSNSLLSVHHSGF